MTAPDWLTPSQRAAWDRGAAAAHAEVANASADTDTADTLVEDYVDCLSDVASIIAHSREQLALHSAAAAGIETIVVTGDRL